MLLLAAGIITGSGSLYGADFEARTPGQPSVGTRAGGPPIRRHGPDLCEFLRRNLDGMAPFCRAGGADRCEGCGMCISTCETYFRYCDQTRAGEEPGL